MNKSNLSVAVAETFEADLSKSLASMQYPSGMGCSSILVGDASKAYSNYAALAFVVPNDQSTWPIVVMNNDGSFIWGVTGTGVATTEGAIGNLSQPGFADINIPFPEAGQNGLCVGIDPGISSTYAALKIVVPSNAGTWPLCVLNIQGNILWGVTVDGSTGSGASPNLNQSGTAYLNLPYPPQEQGQSGIVIGDISKAYANYGGIAIVEPKNPGNSMPITIVNEQDEVLWSVNWNGQVTSK